tara:strand:+ start:535 stop:1275 length:741 start_codon:yes stop_codon:yes gene_type:complete
MIFFAYGKIGLILLKFLFKNFRLDIKAVVLIKSDKEIVKFAKKKISRNNIIFWSKSSILEKKLLYFKPEKFFLLWWPFILKKKLLRIPKNGTINIHPSYLPYFKGKDPNFWAILNRGPYGVSIHNVNTKIDSGKIIFRKKINKIDSTIDGKKLYNINLTELVKLFKNKYKFLRTKKLNGPKLMNKKTKIYKRKDMVKESKISLNKTYKAEYLINLLRAKNFPPNNGVTFKKNNKTYSINIKIKEVD